MMDRFVLLELEGDFATTGLRATLEIVSPAAIYPLKVKGTLPPDPELATCLERHWQHRYRPLGMPQRIQAQKISHKGSIYKQLAACQESARQLRDRLRAWLASPGFGSIDRRLREEFACTDAIRFLLRVADARLTKLPWQEWDFFERYPLAEVAFCPHGVPSLPVLASSTATSVRILAILGHSTGIDVEVDRQRLAALPDATVEFLVEPERRAISDRLWERSWDVLFFAGHSETQGNCGHIYINPHESLSLGELKHGLRAAIACGLQLAIFNSCDGLGLVRELEELQIPQTIVMREPVADRVAQAFLQYFLSAYAGGESLYLSTRRARERLQALEDRFPCASWLPTICQNPLAVPPQWHQLGPSKTPRAVGPPGCRQRPRPRLAMLLLVGLAAAGATWGIRRTGLLEAAELAAYDRLLRARPPETIDARVLVVEIAEADLNALGGYPIADDVLVRAIARLSEHQPAAIGLDAHRARPRSPGRADVAAQFQRHAALFGVCAYGSSGESYAPPSGLTTAQLRDRLGFSNLAVDRFDTVRRQIVSYDPSLAATPSHCTTPYSFSFQLAYRFLQQQGIPVTVTEGARWQFGSLPLQPLSARFGGYQSLDGAGSQIMLNYRNGRPGRSLALQHVLSGKFRPEWVRGRVVLIGYAAPVARDEFLTPYGAMPGVWIHAHATSQLLSTAIEGRSPIAALSPGREILWISAWALAGAGAAWRWRTHPLQSLLAAGILTGGLYQSCLILLTGGIWVPLIPAAAALWLAWGASCWQPLPAPHQHRYPKSGEEIP